MCEWCKATKKNLLCNQPTHKSTVLKLIAHLLYAPGQMLLHSLPFHVFFHFIPPEPSCTQRHTPCSQLHVLETSKKKKTRPTKFLQSLPKVSVYTLIRSSFALTQHYRETLLYIHSPLFGSDNSSDLYIEILFL